MNLTNDLSIRIATPEDAQALLAIYAPYVTNTNISFEYEVPSPEEFRERIRHTLIRYPYLVAVLDGEIVGYAYASPFKTRAAYDWSVELSIYLDENHRRNGIGSALYEKLETILYRQHVCNSCACIAYPNPPSQAFHEKHDYVPCAHFQKSGYKNGQWTDILWMEKELYPRSVPPKPFIPFSELNDL